MLDDAAPTQTSEVTTEAPASEAASATALGGAGEVAASTDGAPADPTPAEAPEAVAETAAAVVPDAYELVAPEGITIDAKALEIATPVFKDLGLSNDQANKLMPVAAQWAQQIQDHANQQIIGQVAADRKAWLDTAKADDEIGGAKWDETLSTAAGALDKLGMVKGSPFRNLLDESGLGNHPEMIRAFRKIGLAIGEDPVFTRANGASTPKRDAAETLYPDDQPKGA